MTEFAYACSLADEELAARRREWRALHERALVRTESGPEGRLMVYRGGEETARILAALIEAERRCCPFLDFTVDRWDDEVRVRIGLEPLGRSEPERAPDVIEGDLAHGLDTLVLE
jgi:hypothetical protein